MNQPPPRQTPVVRPPQQQNRSSGTMVPARGGFTPDEVAGARAYGRYGEAIDIARVFVKSGYFTTRDTAEAAAVKIMFGFELGLEPVAAMQGIHLIPGSSNRPPAMMLDYKTVGHLIRTRSNIDWLIVEHSESACVLQVLRDGEPIFIEDEAGSHVARVAYTLDMARTAGLLGRDNTWKTHPGDLLFSRALNRVARRYCPEVLAGQSVSIVTPEEVEEEPLGDQVRGQMWKLAAQKKVTDEQRAEYAERVHEGVTSWAADGGLTNAEGQVIIGMLEALPDPPPPVATEEEIAKLFEGLEDEELDRIIAIATRSREVQSGEGIPVDGAGRTANRGSEGDVEAAQSLGEGAIPSPPTGSPGDRVPESALVSRLPPIWSPATPRTRGLPKPKVLLPAGSFWENRRPRRSFG